MADEYPHHPEDGCEAEVERLRARVAELDEAEADALEKADELEAEVERLRAEQRQQYGMLTSEARKAIEENERLRRDKANLRKAVQWLAGTVHDLHPGGGAKAPFGSCAFWECQRARARLNEMREEA